MKISYNWLKEYLPTDELTTEIAGNPQKISAILTSVGLEVEALEKYEEVENNLEGLIVGEVIECTKHTDADKLKIVNVDNGKGDTLQIVCGASNVEVGQKVVIAPVGVTLYPVSGEPIRIKKAKIRGVESDGMLCAADEIGVGSDHQGIIVLPQDAKPGMSAREFYGLYEDWIFEIGLTPNRMDAMSHLGVAKDVCAYISHHSRKQIKVVEPFKNSFKEDNNSEPVTVEIKNTSNCERYAGLSISGITITDSPIWLQNKLKSIGLHPVNNIVDITNFILHETGQPLHAFDLSKITAGQIIVETLPEGTPFITLDGKQRKLSNTDIMICDGNDNPMCIAGVFGGAESGIQLTTTSIFLESAVFNPSSIRKSMLLHNLRTEAAVRFEKGINIENTVAVLKRAALLIKELAGGKITSKITDFYPQPREKEEIVLSNHYLKKISGKNYHPDTVTNILKSLNFTILREGIDGITVAVPYSNPDITIPADVIEEIMRIDGLDNIDIPKMVKMTPSISHGLNEVLTEEKITSWLVNNGFSEIFTNSITNSKYFDSETLTTTVKIINSLSEDLNVMRPEMLPTGLECIAYNLNRKNSNLLFFEFGNTYSKIGSGYSEKETLALYLTGNKNEQGWNLPVNKIDIFFVKGVCENIFSLAGINNFQFDVADIKLLEEGLIVSANKIAIGSFGSVSKSELEIFSIKQPVFFLCIDWGRLKLLAKGSNISYSAINKFPEVQRDLSMIVDKTISYQQIENLVKSLHLSKLTHIELFDVFENEKLGMDKRSLAFRFVFSDKEKTLTDAEVENVMNKIISSLEKEVNALIRNNA
ncbi:MAG: phenylalanine--tRNA ligase subunit beta [Ginsengibacter sp.]